MSVLFYSRSCSVLFCKTLSVSHSRSACRADSKSARALVKRRRPDKYEACRKTSFFFPRETLGGGGAISIWFDVPPGL